MATPILLTDTIYWVTTALHQSPALLAAADIILKSFVVMLPFALLDTVFGPKLNNTSRHLLWLNALLCLAILPWLPALFALRPGVVEGRPGATVAVWFELTVVPQQTSENGQLNAGLVLLVCYLTPALLMLGRLLIALQISRSIHKQADLLTEPQTTDLLTVLQTRLGISRQVSLRVSDTIDSPVSFGLLRPTILLPAHARDWSTSIMTDVLLHELCHIKRLDWLTTLLALLVGCVFWMNPLVWLAVKRLREESEHSCDAAVLNAGRSDTDYAQSLLSVATRCIQARRSRHIRDPLMQTMLDQNTLKTRISRVLEENKMQASDMQKQIKKTMTLLLMLSAGVLSIMGVTQVLSAQEQRSPPVTRPVNEELLPLHSEEPVYPRSAAEAGIEGWVHVRFTVNAAGTIDDNSLAVVDAEPADTFNNSALEAARKFRFRPRITEGEPVAVPNVQYVFRYKLQASPTDPVEPMDQAGRVNNKEPLNTRAPLAPETPKAPVAPAD